MKYHMKQTAINTSTEKITALGLSILRQSHAHTQNTLLSPLSVACAMGMAANGAGGATRAQMEETFDMSLQEWNTAAAHCMRALSAASGAKASAANSLWLNDRHGLRVQDAFRKALAEYFGASFFQMPFDGQTVHTINQWVSEQTAHQIPQLLDRLEGDAALCLINALAFDGKWEEPYKPNQVQEGIFHAGDGQKQPATFLHSSEKLYLEDSLSTGFVKYYENRTYAFAALLPREGISLEDYLSSLTGQRLCALLQGSVYTTVEAALPRFTQDYSTDLCDTLRNLGIVNAFDSALADFTALCDSDTPLCISHILHKTHICVEENGTQAAAASAVAIARCSIGPIEVPKLVRLDKPFLYAILDCDTSLPLFLGTVLAP